MPTFTWQRQSLPFRGRSRHRLFMDRIETRFFILSSRSLHELYGDGCNGCRRGAILGLIDCGLQITPMKEKAQEMALAGK